MGCAVSTDLGFVGLGPADAERAAKAAAEAERARKAGLATDDAAHVHRRFTVELQVRALAASVEEVGCRLLADHLSTQAALAQGESVIRYKSSLKDVLKDTYDSSCY